MGSTQRQRSKFVLLFDGTGNKFSGTDSDSNILKILRMLDRNDTSQVHYYQPGIGTYVHSTTYSHTSKITRASSWFRKARDAAIGASFDEHVMGGYKFLMRHYQPGDDLYIFGFSRGAYTARYLAEMLDYIGLLEAGNEELARFAWKAFAKWQRRLERTEEEKEEKKKMFKFMKAFRDTFARPIKRIRFLGLFDTVNSVSQFESRWLMRSHHPYTATSSAIVVRHAVSIDERRAKFRQDLLGVTKPQQDAKSSHESDEKIKAEVNGEPPKAEQPNRQLKVDPEPNGELKAEIHRAYRTKIETTGPQGTMEATTKKKQGEQDAGIHNPRYRRASVTQLRNRSAERGRRAQSPSHSLNLVVEDDGNSIGGSRRPSIAPRVTGLNLEELEEEAYDEALPQDVLEVWFSGGHGDIGGGWIPEENEVLLSQVPLVWMVREAQQAGLRFDPQKVQEMNCGWDVGYDDEARFERTKLSGGAPVPKVEVTGTTTPEKEDSVKHRKDFFHKHFHRASTESIVHDCLTRGGGLSFSAVAAWSFMDNLPFRRMDLQPDSTWKSVRFPLPRGEVRDMPDTALIHGSVIRRMQVDENYRPGNLIVGGGGRGVRVAPKHLGMGEWDVVREEGDPVGECFIRRKKACHKPETNGHKE